MSQKFVPEIEAIMVKQQKRYEQSLIDQQKRHELNMSELETVRQKCLATPTVIEKVKKERIFPKPGPREKMTPEIVKALYASTGSLKEFKRTYRTAYDAALRYGWSITGESVHLTEKGKRTHSKVHTFEFEKGYLNVELAAELLKKEFGGREVGDNKRGKALYMFLYNHTMDGMYIKTGESLVRALDLLFPKSII